MAIGSCSGGEGDRGRRCPCALLRGLLLACLTAVALLGISSSALALSQRGHQFGFAFNAGGGASAIAVNESLTEGNVYVGAGKSVSRFTCSATACSPSEPPFKLDKGEAESIAIDNSAESPSKGNVYVASEEEVHRYNAKGEKLGEPIKGYEEPGESKEEFGEIHGIAVDAKGDLWVYHEESVTEFNDSNTPLHRNEFIKHQELELGSCFPTPGFAVDPQGEVVYAGQERLAHETACEEGINVIAKFTAAGERLSKGLNEENSTAVATDLENGDVYVGNVNTIAAYQPDGSLIQRFGSGDLTRAHSIAVDAKTNDVYVADFTPEEPGRVVVFEPAHAGPPAVDAVSAENLPPKAPPLASAKLDAEVDPNGNETEVRLEYGTADCASEGSSCTSLPPQHLGPAFGDQSISVEVTDLQPGTRYFLRVVATSECGLEHCTAERSQTFDTLPASSGLLADNRAWELVSPPEKDGAGIEAIGGETGQGPAGGIMQAAEDGNSVTYTANAPIVPEPEGSHAPEGTQVLSTRSAHGWSSEDLATASRRAEGLTADGPQEYRLFSQDLSAAIVRPLGVEQKQDPPLVSGLEEEEKSIYIRHNASCQSAPATCFEALLTAANVNVNEKEEREGYAGGAAEFLDATPDLSHVVFETTVSLRVTPTQVDPAGLYEWHAGALALVSRLPGTNEPAVEPKLGQVTPSASERNTRHAISNDGSRVFWSAAAGNRIYMRDTVANTTVQVNSVVQGAGLTEPPEEEPELDEAHYQTASVDGSHVFFTDTARLTPDSTLTPVSFGSPADLYVWVPAGVEGCGPSSATPEGPGEWSGGGCVTDLTASSSVRSADVQGLVIGASEDGTYAYFVANGVLAEGAQPGNCNDQVAAEACELYGVHLAAGKWETRAIAHLSSEDANDWVSSALGAVLGQMTSRVAPNGGFLAFMSNRSLTGYENIDAHSGARDEEVFLYDWGARHLTCASCRPGAKPEGVFDTEEAGEGVGLLIDRPKLWLNRWLAGSIPGWTPLAGFIAPEQSRYLTNDGRLFFNSPDELTELPAGEHYVHKENVYQYEPAGVGGCGRSAGCVSLLSSGTSSQESAFVDASPSGNDVFFVTSQQLLFQDRDHSFDLYDARVCTDASPCLPPESPPPPPCGDEASCRPSGTPPPTFGTPGTTTTGASTNTAQSETRGEINNKPKKPTRKQLLAKALKKCRTKYKGHTAKAKKRRAACEKQAQRKYGSKRSVKHSRKARR
jgi:hypothetical protein